MLGASTASLILLLAVVVPFMIVEAIRSGANERMLRRRGAVEAAGDPYTAISIVYIGGFIAMAIEGVVRGGVVRRWAVLGLLIFTLAKLLKFSAVRALGPLWSFRILVLPERPIVRSGPYRYLRHPNYVAVFLEFAGAACMMNAPIAGPVVALVFFYFLRQRIAVEERALGLRGPSSGEAARVE
jgi:methyltransferase